MGNPGKSKVAILLIAVLGIATFLSLYDYNRSRPVTVREDNVLREYYIHHDSWGGPFPFDEYGIPLVDYRGEIGLQYNPVTVSQYALAHYALYLENSDIAHRDIFLKQADWLVKNLVTPEGGDFGVWKYHFDFAPFQMKSPWISAMAQGQGISVLLRAYQLTAEKRHLEAAEAALRTFEIPIEEGGATHTDERGFVWYAEYPTDPPSHVLNGFIFALFGLYDFYRATGNEKGLGLFEEGIKTLEANLHRYDTGSWSTYDLREWKRNKPYTFIFRFKTDTRHPLDRHPIDEVTVIEVLNGIERTLVSLDIGHQEDTTAVSVNDSHLYYNPQYMDWSESYVLDGRTVRNYENRGGKWAHAPFDLRFAVNPSAKYYLSVAHKDVSDEPIYVEVFLIGMKYFRFGELQRVNSRRWESCRIEIPHSLLSLRYGATELYHRIHIEQLRALHQLTGREVFQEYALRFEEYLEHIEGLAVLGR